MNKKKVIGIILFIIIVILLIFIICTLRKFIIIKKLRNNLGKYISSSNYHLKSIRKENDGTIEYNYYKKGNKMAYFIETRNKEGIINKYSVYNNGERIDLFIESPNEKKADLDITSFSGEPKINDYFTEDLLDNKDLFVLSIKSKIEKTEYNEKKCYIIKNFKSPSMQTDDGSENEMYIDKETGLRLKLVRNHFTTETEYEFDNVNDSVFVEPDISQYTLQN